MRLVFLTTRLFWPADSGRKVVLWNYCKGVHEQLGYDVYVYSFCEGKQGIKELSKKPSFIKDIKLALPISKFRKAAAIVRALAVEKKEPLQCALYKDSANKSLFRKYCEQIKPDVVIVDMIRLAPYFDAIKDMSCIKIIDLDDLLSKRYQRQLLESKYRSDILGNYSQSTSRILSAITNSRCIREWVLKSEGRRCKASEVKYAKQYDASILISPVEAKQFSMEIGEDSVFIATMGAVSYDYIDEQKRLIKYDFGFLGNLNTPANRDSLDYIAQEILPKLPDASLRVIGVCPEDLRSRYTNNGQISFSGRVNDVRDELLKCKIFLSPLRYGTGIKTKILEAMGIGLPVISNSIGFEGMAIEPGINCLRGESTKEIIDEAVQLLNSAELRKKIGIAGIRYVQESHSWASSIRQIGRCVEYCRAKQGVEKP